MNYGHHGRDLLLELKRAQSNDHKASTSAGAVPPYNDRLVRACLQDLQLHVQALQDQVNAQRSMTSEKPSMNVRPSLLLQSAAVGRNKRCLLAYHKIRADRLAAAYWNNTNLSSTGMDYSNLCPAEEEFVKHYAQLARDYAGMWNVPDLRSYGTTPPQPLSKVQVLVQRTVADGPIVLESGATVTLQKGSVHYLSYADVEAMLRDGSLTLLSTEEEDTLHQATGQV